VTSGIAAAIVATTAILLASRRMFVSVPLGITSAALFVMTPLLWRQLQSAPASLYPLPFAAGWLFAVSHLDDGRSRAGWAALAGAVLGLGMCSSLASIVMMPVYLLLTIACAALLRACPWRHLACMVVAFATAAAPLGLYVLRHPAAYRETINAHDLYDANRFNVLQGLREMASWVGLTARSEVYFDYFNPAFLFLTGDVLVPPLVLLIPVGLFHLLDREGTLPARLTLLAFLASPFAASLTAEPPIAPRIIFITPFAAIVSVCGVRRLISLRFRIGSVREWVRSTDPPPRSR
jgi:hypothetical protein